MPQRQSVKKASENMPSSGTMVTTDSAQSATLTSSGVLPKGAGSFHTER